MILVEILETFPILVEIFENFLYPWQFPTFRSKYEEKQWSFKYNKTDTLNVGILSAA